MAGQPYISKMSNFNRAVIRCPCGSSFQRIGKNNHWLTDIHQNYINPKPLIVNLKIYINCVCGARMRLVNKKKHLKSQKHINYLNIKIDS